MRRTELIGRDADIARVLALIARSPIVTVVGPGGVGKTSLAIAVAHRTAPSFAEGAAFVDLAHVDDPAMVAPEVARRLDLVNVSGSEPLEHLVANLRSLQALIVLDNFEHLVDAAPLVAELSVRCPEIVWLVTSRRRLGVSAELVVELPPLPVPETDGGADLADVPSVALFCERAAAVTPRFRAGAAELAAVGELCRRVDGLPLAIELIAAQVRLLPPQALLARLSEADHGLALLTGGPRDADSRHRELRRTIAWSVALLGPAAARLLPRLAVFREGWTLEALEDMCREDFTSTEVLEALIELVDLHLVQPVDVGGDEARFRLLETVRDFAGEALADAADGAEIHDRHAQYFVAFASRAGAGLESRAEPQWAASVDRELPNVRAGLQHLRATGRVEDGLAAATALGPYWLDRGPLREGHDWIDRFLASGDGSAALRAVAEGWKARLAADLGDADVSPARMEQLHRARDVLDEAGDVTAWLRISNHIGAVMLLGGPPSESEAFLVDTLAERSVTGWFRAELLISLAVALLDRDDRSRVEATVDEIVRIAGEVGHDRIRGHALMLRGISRAGDALASPPGVAENRAAADIEEAFRLAEAIGDRRGAARAAGAGGVVALGAGNHARAAAMYLRCLNGAVARGYWRYVAWTLVGSIVLAAHHGQSTEGARILGAISPTLDRLRNQSPAPIISGFDAAVDRLRVDLGTEFATAARAGEQAGWAAALDTARAVLGGLVGDAALHRQDSPARSAPSGEQRLTDRELDVVRLLAGGFTNQQIGDELGISAKTVMNHTVAVYRKLAVRGRAEAVAHAVRHGLIRD